MDVTIVHSLSAPSEFKERVGKDMELESLTDVDGTLAVHYIVRPILMFGDHERVAFSKIFVPAKAIGEDKHLLAMIKKAKEIYAELKGLDALTREYTKLASESLTQKELDRKADEAKAAMFGSVLGIDMKEKIAEATERAIAEKEEAVASKAKKLLK